MPIESIGPTGGRPIEIRMSELRQRRLTDKSRRWTNENSRIIAEPKKEAAQKAGKEKRLERDFKYSQSDKARFDLNKALGDIVRAKPSRDVKSPEVQRKASEKLEKKQQFNFQAGRIYDGVANMGPGEKRARPLTEQEFLAKEKGVATDQNSTVLSSSKTDDKSAGIGNPTATRKEISSNMQVATQRVGKIDAEKKATIGSFNIEWLGQKKRTEEDYRNIAKVIKDSDAALLGIQEVANIEGLKRVMKHLPNYGYVLGKSGHQMVGMIFDKDRVKYDANSIQTLDEVTVGNPHMRAPLSVDMKVDNYDFNFTVMHLKAGFKDRSINIRNKQADVMNKWIQKRQKTNPDKDMIIVGDYNDFVKSPTLSRMDKGDTVDYATSEAGKDFYTNIRYRSVIDHGALSNAPGGASEEYVKGSLRTIDENKYPNYKHGVSDHKPIFFQVRSGVDND